jgi:hypothetical protein
MATMGLRTGILCGYAPGLTTTIMHPRNTATATGELFVQHSPTTVVPDIMAVGITGGHW